MPIKLSELINKTADRSFEYDGQTIALKVYTQRVTPAFRANWQEVEKDASKEMRCQLIVDMLAGWDVLAEDEKPEAITYEFLQRCPDTFLNQLVETVEEAIFGNPTNGSNSSSGSLPTTSPQES